jgi:dihydroorotate dehydrogenase electron transfer subunit
MTTERSASSLFLRPTLHRPFTLAQIRVENYRTQTLIFRQPLPAQPGQFVMVWLPGVDEKPFSVAAAEPLALTVTAVGPFTRAMHRLSVGDRVWVRGPLGQGFRLEGGRILLVGGGYGVAPLLFLAKEAIAEGCVVDVCIGARRAEDVLLARDFETAGTAVRVATEDGSLGSKGLVTIAMEEAIDENRPSTVYACGPVKMLVAVDQLCANNNLPRQLSWEAHMRCGIGVCGSCELLSLEPDSGTALRPSSGQALRPGSGQVRHTGCPASGWLVCLDGPVSFTPSSTPNVSAAT